MKKIWERSDNKGSQKVLKQRPPTLQGGGGKNGPKKDQKKKVGRERVEKKNRTGLRTHGWKKKEEIGEVKKAAIRKNET